MQRSLAPLEVSIADQLQRTQAELLSTLAEHVAVPTGQGHRAGLDAYRTVLETKLGSLGAELSDVKGESRPEWVWPLTAASWVPPVLVARSQLSKSSTGARVLIVGHMDTVHDPAGAFRELTIEKDGKRATGPGAADMKGGIVIALAVLETLRESGVPLQWTFALNSDEETGSFHSASALRKLAREHDVGIVLEPALPGGAMAIERMGSGQFMIEVHGRSAHVGRDFSSGVSAVTKLGELLVEIGAWSRPDEGLIVNVGPLRGAPVTNAVPDRAMCWGNVRFASPEIGTQIGTRLAGLATTESAMPCVIVRFVPNRPAKPRTTSVQRVADVISSAARDLGQSVEQVATGGVCDGNLLQDAGLPTIDTMGVRGGNLHRTDEFIEVDSLSERAVLLAISLMRLAGLSG